MIAASRFAHADDTVSASAQVEAHEPGPGTMEAGLFGGTFISNYFHQFYDADKWPGLTRPNLDRWSPELGLRFGYFPHEMFGVEGELSWISAGFDGGRASIFGGTVQGVFQLPGRLTPFVALGVGARLTSSDTLGDDSDFPIHIGGGVRFYVTDSLALRLDLRYLRGPSEQDPYTLNAGYGEINVGVSYTLASRGTTAPPPVENPDPDGDGVLGAADACPNEPAKTVNGCPPKDTDGDGLMDDVDKCPTEPETVNGFQDDDGCPDVIPDSDGDKIPDNVDKCPNEPEDMDGFEDADGCPDLDNDQDGVTDSADACPMEKGPVENKGCPDKDRDGDGIVDRLDNCPDEKGTEKNHGCKAKQLVVITTTQLKILDKVFFRTGKATIDRRSNKLLDNIAAVMQQHPEIKKLRVEGHTDDVGNDSDNKNLSQARADAVAAYLIGKGIDSSRLVSVGFGEEKPIADNKTSKGREQNRRVEFNLEETGAVPASP